MIKELRKPNITANTTDGQLSQVKQYLFQLTSDLNFALNLVEKRIDKADGNLTVAGTKTNAGANFENNSAQNNFSAVKDLIIKSADIVNAYCEMIEKRLSGKYVAESDFGTYKKETEKQITETAENTTANYNSIQEIYDQTGNLSELRKDGFYMRTGWLYDDADTGNKIGGIELGQISDDGTDIRKSIARFTTDELAFYDGDGTDESNKIAWFSKYKMHIRAARIEGNLELGKYVLDTSKGIAFRWIGG